MVHNASASASFHECQIETVLTNWAGGGEAGSGSRSTAVDDMGYVAVRVVEGSTVGVAVNLITGVAPGVVPAVAVAWGVLVGTDTGVKVGLAVACGGGYGWFGGGGYGWLAAERFSGAETAGLIGFSR